MSFLLITKLSWGDQIKKDEMGEAENMHAKFRSENLEASMTWETKI
jgi:hypothetical protein